MEGAGAAAEAAAVTDAPAYHPDSLLVQWHLTDRCNLRCRHCYGDATVSDLKSSELTSILTQIRTLITVLRRRKGGRRFPAHINVTGGEPFLRDDFFPLLESFHALRDEFSFAILSNGSLINPPVAGELQRLRPGFVQLSLDGEEKTHDAIRGTGDFARVLQGVTTLSRAKIPVLLSFTAQRSNYQEFGAVAELGRHLGVKRVWADRFLPLGGAEQERDQVLTPEETREFFENIRDARCKGGKNSRTEIAMHRALQFLVGGGRPYRCQAGSALITILASGDLCPCRRLPLSAGNLLTSNLVTLYDASPLFQQLRNPATLQGCVGCLYERVCGGGLNCLGYALTGELRQRDPGCWLK